jgi:Tfp pilus assembly protein PilO
MHNLEKIKRQFTLIVAVLGVIDLVLLAYLLWPGTSPSAKQAQEDALQQQETTLSREVTPLRGIDQKLTQTRVDMKKFYEQKVPAQFSAISQHLEKLVQETGVTTQGIRYSQDKTADREKNDLPDVQRVSIDTTVTGEYSKIARFINALEQDKFVFVINQISLTGSEAGNVVSLQIKFETFLKEI